MIRVPFQIEPQLLLQLLLLQPLPPGSLKVTSEDNFSYRYINCCTCFYYKHVCTPATVAITMTNFLHPKLFPLTQLKCSSYWKVVLDLTQMCNLKVNF